MSYWYRKRYVPVGERRAKAEKQLKKRLKKGQEAQPVEIDGTTIARTFWGKGWCKHLESFSDYSNRLPRGRTYARNGSVCHLDIQSGRVEALVAGSSLYTVTITIKTLRPGLWKGIKERCAGQIGSMLELLQGKLSNEVMAVVSDRSEGLFPQPGEMNLSCSCPDWAVMCKHVAAVLYGVGNRLDTCPELLFLLRDVDAEELIAAELALPDVARGAAGDALSGDQLGAIFGIDFAPEDQADAPPVPAPKRKGRPRAEAKAAPEKKAPAAKIRKPGGPAKVTRSGTKPARTGGAPAPRIRPSGKSVARLRKKLGLSVAEFAGALGVSSATVRRWESDPGPLDLQRRPLGALAALHERAKAK